MMEELHTGQHHLGVFDRRSSIEGAAGVEDLV